MNIDFKDCVKKGKIKEFPRGFEIAPQELETAAADLEKAKKNFKEGDVKWATVQLYYSMFHAARALLYSKNFKEHSHYCLIQAMRELFVSKGLLPVTMIEALQSAKNLREDADYYSRWSGELCEKHIKSAEEFIEKTRELLK